MMHIRVCLDFSLIPTDVLFWSGASSAQKFYCPKRSPLALFILQRPGLGFALECLLRTPGGVRPSDAARERQKRLWPAHQKDCLSRADSELSKMHTRLLKRGPRAVSCAVLVACAGPTASRGAAVWNLPLYSLPRLWRNPFLKLGVKMSS